MHKVQWEVEYEKKTLWGNNVYECLPEYVNIVKELLYRVRGEYEKC